MRFAALPLLLVLATTSSVAAAPRMVFRFEGRDLSVEMERVPEQLATAITRELGGVQAAFSIMDAARTQCIATTEELSDACLDLIAENHHAKRLVWGLVTSTDDGVKVTLTRFVLGKNRQRRSFLLRGTTLEMTDALVEGARSWFDDLGVDARRDRAPKDTSTRGAPLAQSRGVSTPTIMTLIGGGTMLLTGAGFLYSSNQIADEIRESHARNEADFDRLVALENTGTQRQTIGNVLTGVGILAVTYGIIRVITERRHASTETRSRIAPVPIEGGAALVYERSLR